ncbi:MAG TPA: hypothetical protein VMS65_00685 [Polyangiaceae bacterium]|nr:hypothetical protein [Polyangiaceae bacterium]
MPSRLVRAVVATLGVVVALGCASQDDVIVKTGADKKLSDSQIDSEPVALLPGSAVGVAYVDTKKLFASSFGARILAVTERRMPLPPEAGFDPKRDLEALWLGLYSMQGADAAGVAIGTFDRQKIEAAADGTHKTPLGEPVTKSTYSGRALYTAGNVGFTVLTSRVALFGNDVGVRRAIDRIEEGRAKKQLPKYMTDLLATPNAPLVVAGDLTSNPLPAAAREQLSFTQGLETLALVGNFDEPGINLAGTLNYGDTVTAERGAQNLLLARNTLDRYAPFLALIGIPQPIRRLEAQPKEKTVSFVMAADGAAVAALLDKGQELMTTGRP